MRWVGLLSVNANTRSSRTLLKPSLAKIANTAESQIAQPFLDYHAELAYSTELRNSQG